MTQCIEGQSEVNLTRHIIVRIYLAIFFLLMSISHASHSESDSTPEALLPNTKLHMTKLERHAASFQFLYEQCGVDDARLARLREKFDREVSAVEGDLLGNLGIDIQDVQRLGRQDGGEILKRFEERVPKAMRLQGCLRTVDAYLATKLPVDGLELAILAPEKWETQSGTLQTAPSGGNTTPAAQVDQYRLCSQAAVERLIERSALSTRVVVREAQLACKGKAITAHEANYDARAGRIWGYLSQSGDSVRAKARNEAELEINSLLRTVNQELTAFVVNRRRANK